MRRAIVIIICIIICFNISVFGATKDGIYYSKEEMIWILNNFKQEDSTYQNIEEKNLSEMVWKRNGLLVTKKNANKQTIMTKNVIKKGETTSLKNEGDKEKRYLGTTPEGYIVENPDFPANVYNGKFS